MIKFLVLLFYTLGPLAHATVIIENKKNKVEVNPFTDEPEIKLPKEALKAVNKWNNKFKPFPLKAYSPTTKKLFQERAKNEVPMAFVSDLDGDKTEDVAILGEDSKKQYLLALINKNNKWKLTVVKTWDFANIEKSNTPGEYEQEVGIPFYILPAQSGERGLQVESYLGTPEVCKF